MTASTASEDEMSNSAIGPILLATAFALAGCDGGGGGYDVGSTLPPPVTPTPTPTPAPTAFALIPAATTSQQFAVAGAARMTPEDPTLRLGTADLLQVRYIASSNSYQVELPGSLSWIDLTGKSESEAAGGEVTVARQSGFQYSSLINWFRNGTSRGVEALGIATPAGAVPATGSATFKAFALGTTPESHNISQLVSPFVYGPITFNFDFAQGSLSGSLDAFLDPEWHDYDLGTFNFRDTVYSSGSTTFSGKFDTNLPGVNSFNGLFTGPNAQELIGNFALPYKSPIDGLTYQAGGAFVGKK
jgi:hypothetical protein